MIEAIREMVRGGPAVWLADTPPRGVPAGTGAVVQTSGSTGAGRLVVLSRAALLAAATASQQVLGPMTWHLPLDPRYVAGLMVVVRATVAGRPVLPVRSDLSDLRPGGDGDAISIVPTQLHRALADPVAARALAAMEAILVGGARLEPGLRARAEAAGLRVVETYGMSETCGGCVWDGVPLPGASVELVPDPRAPEGAGRVALSGPMLFSGYLSDAVATAAVLRDGALLTSDHGRLVDGRLVVGGRLDDVVTSGGVNVDVGAVRLAVAARDPEAWVLAVADPEWGSRLVLFATRGSLESWRDVLAADLPRTSLPRQFVAVAELPRTAGGKPDREKLLALLQP